MLSYQTRSRTFSLKNGNKPNFPVEATIYFYCLPLQPFGKETKGGRTCVRGTRTEMGFNANTGEHFIFCHLAPLKVDLSLPGGIIGRIDGNIVSIRHLFASLREAHDLITNIYYVLPILLNVDFGDPPYVERVEMVVGDSRLGWELETFCQPIHQTTQQEQEDACAIASHRLSLVKDDSQIRLLAGLRYFHVACRLARRGQSPGEFLAEVILNLAKSLEALFPPGGDGRTRDAVREGLKSLGFTEIEIENHYIPIMALRSEIDSAHVQLAVFESDDLKVLQEYVDNIELPFRNLFRRLLESIVGGTFQLSPFDAKETRRSAKLVIQKLKMLRTS